MPPYRHTQAGWAMAVVFVGILVFALALVQGPIGLVASAPAAIVLLLFGWLTVTVDNEAIAFAFGIGLIRRRIPLRSIASWQVVRNHWWCGWGIRFYGRGMLYNVSGLSAVELRLTDGRHLRIGTDEPDRLAQALTHRLGTPPPFDASGSAARGRAPWWAWAIAAVSLAIAGFAAAGIVLHRRPPAITISADRIVIRSGLYTNEIPLGAITRLSLETTMPRVTARTNGFAMGGLLRGHFVVEGMGRGRLFVDRNEPPFIVIRTSDGFTIVNDDDPARTQALYEASTAALANRRRSNTSSLAR